MGFIEKQTDPTTPMHWKGNMQADYFYPAGIAGDKFFQHLKQNDTFLATKCSKCNKVLFPPRLYCEDCFIEISDDNWIEVPASGTIRLFTVAKLNAHGEKMKEPRVMALIDVEKTDSSMLGVIKTQDLESNLQGAKVKAVLRPKDKREGTMKDILHFELI